MLRHDGGLGFAMLEYAGTFNDFLVLAEPELERVRSQTVMDASKDRPDTIYYSIIPGSALLPFSHPGSSEYRRCAYPYFRKNFYGKRQDDDAGGDFMPIMP
ncbi:MAG: hypothetical protein U5N56_07070 [Candidatus Marinimicrobia bacterium]|nr:hypothetical protein [Candidatus Neomarinimicrobiota bacterium]